MCAMSFFGDAGGGNGGSLPFQRTADPSKLGMLLNLQQAELLRLQRYMQHWKFYYSRHWAFAREDGDPLVTLNYVRKIIDKSVAFLFGKGFSVKVPDPLIHLTAPYLDDVWKMNAKEKFLWDMGIMGGVTGDCFVLVTYEEPTPLERRLYPYAKGRVRFNLLESSMVFPDYDPLDKSRMRSVRIESLFWDGAPTEIGETLDSSAGRQLNMRRRTQIITAEYITTKTDGQDAITRANKLGEIPIIHIKNQPAPNEIYGIPDALDIIDVNREINEKLTDISDTINYHAAPVTVVYGAKAKQLEKGPRQIWSGLPADARIEHLSLEGDLAAANTYVAGIKESMFELSDIPEGALGKSQEISNTAGVALHLQYAPLMELTGKKRAQYGPGIERMNYFALRIGQAEGLLDLPFDIDKKTGGKIALVEADTYDIRTATKVRKRVPRAFLMNKNTFDFEKPEDVRLSYIRQYSFGSEIREEPFFKIIAEHRGVSKSYWDPEPDTTVDDEAERTRAERNEQSAASAPAPAAPGEGAPQPAPRVEVKKKAPVPKMSQDQFEVPEEPEDVTVIVELVDPITGERTGERTTTQRLVPVGVTRPEYLNPFTAEVQFADPLPKDLSLQADLYAKYREMRIVSKRWVQERIPDITPHIDSIEKQLESEGITEAAQQQKDGNPLEDQSMEREMSAHNAPSGPTSKINPPSDDRGANTGRL